MFCFGEHGNDKIEVIEQKLSIKIKIIFFSKIKIVKNTKINRRRTMCIKCFEAYCTVNLIWHVKL